MSVRTYTYATTLQPLDCGDCGIPFALPTDLHAARLNDGGAFYCPNGHHISYSETNNQRLAKEKERLQREVQWQRDQRTAAERDAATQRRRAAAAKGQLTKARNRAANGVCPVPGCKRSFTNVVAHVRTAHPDFHDHAETAP